MLLNYGVGEDSCDTSRRSNQSILKDINRGCSLEGLILKLNPNTLATWCEELTHWKRPWCWERLKAGGEGDDRGWDAWTASSTWWTWVWVNSGSWWWTGRPGVLQFMGLQRVRHNWATELNWTELTWHILVREYHVSFMVSFSLLYKFCLFIYCSIQWKCMCCGHKSMLCIEIKLVCTHFLCATCCTGF